MDPRELPFKTMFHRDDDRRKGAPPAPAFGELLAEAGWEPESADTKELENWIRSAGLVPERRETDRRRR